MNRRFSSRCAGQRFLASPVAPMVPTHRWCWSDTNAAAPVTLSVVGRVRVATRFTGEVWVRGTVAYTTSWGSRGSVPGNAIHIWDVSGNTPQLRDSVIVSNATTLGDVQATDDGRYLVVATELSPGSIVVYDLTDPFKPREISRFLSANITRGVHTAEVQRVAGRNYAFLAVNQGTNHNSRLIIVDIGTLRIRARSSAGHGAPFIHMYSCATDSYYRLARWDDIWDSAVDRSAAHRRTPCC